MTFGGLLSLTPIFKPVGGKQPHHNHGCRRQKWPPIAAHELHFGSIRIWLIGDDDLSKQICFSLAMSWSMALKMLRWWGNDGNKSRLVIGAFWRVIDPLIARTKYPLARGIVLVNPTSMRLTLELMCSNRSLFTTVAAMVMGDVIGRWLWCLRQCKPYK